MKTIKPLAAREDNTGIVKLDDKGLEAKFREEVAFLYPGYTNTFSDGRKKTVQGSFLEGKSVYLQCMRDVPEFVDYFRRVADELGATSFDYEFIDGISFANVRKPTFTDGVADEIVFIGFPDIWEAYEVKKDLDLYYDDRARTAVFVLSDLDIANARKMKTLPAQMKTLADC